MNSFGPFESEDYGTPDTEERLVYFFDGILDGLEMSLDVGIEAPNFFVALSYITNEDFPRSRILATEKVVNVPNLKADSIDWYKKDGFIYNTKSYRYKHCY
jgi:hypothetical protein